MGKKLYVSHLGSAINSSALEDLFTTVGDVESINFPKDPLTGIAGTVAYVEMFSDQQAADCISRFHGRKVMGYTLAVVEDVPRIAPLVSLLPKKKKTRKAPIRLSAN